MFQVTWAISCSGRPGKKPETIVPAAPAAGDDAAVKLIKLVSPEENTAFKLKDPVKVVLDIVDKDKLPDSVLISFDGKAVATIKIGSMGIFHTRGLHCYHRKKIIESYCLQGSQITEPSDPLSGYLFRYNSKTIRL